MRLNQNKINEIIKYHNIGLSVRKIAKKIGISKTTVQKYITKYHNNELSQLTIFPEKKIYSMIPIIASHQQRQEFIQLQEHHDSNFLEDPLYSQ